MQPVPLFDSTRAPFGPKQRVHTQGLATSHWVVVEIMVPFLGALNNRCRVIIGTQKGTMILTTTRMKA